MYLNHAEFRIQNRNYEQVGYATYHINGHGGLDFGKFSCTDSKVSPVLDDLFKGAAS